MATGREARRLRRAQPKEPVRCSFCEKTREEVRVMIEGPKGFICDECIAVCSGMVEESVGRSGHLK
jgi:ATP-dependent Clp protease ATP-binding subunit ClpX